MKMVANAFDPTLFTVMLPMLVNAALTALIPIAAIMCAGFLYLLCRHFVTGEPIAAKHVRRVVIVGAVLLALLVIPYLIQLIVWLALPTSGTGL